MELIIRAIPADDMGPGSARPFGGRGLGGDRQGGDGAWAPAVDIFETADAVVLVAELAGVGREEVRVIVDESVVRIYGERRPSCLEAPCRFHRMEITPGSFVRSFRITVPFDPQRAEARAEDGLLYVRLPKLPPARAHRIEVEQI